MLWSWGTSGFAMLTALQDLACFTIGDLDGARGVFSSLAEHCFGGDRQLALRLHCLCHLDWMIYK